MTRKLAGLAIAAAAVWLVAPALAQEKGDMPPEAQAEMEVYLKAGSPGEVHRTLADSAGAYDVKVKSWHVPGAPPVEESGTATRKMVLDGRVLIEEFSSAMMGMPFKGQGMHGYDNVTGKHWSTWVDNMSTGVMVSEGSCDTRGVCTFKGTFNDAVKKTPVTLRMSSRWSDGKTQVFEMYGPAPDGSEMKMMEITYYKKS